MNELPRAARVFVGVALVSLQKPLFPTLFLNSVTCQADTVVVALTLQDVDVNIGERQRAIAKDGTD